MLLQRIFVNAVPTWEGSEPFVRRSKTKCGLYGRIRGSTCSTKKTKREKTHHISHLESDAPHPWLEWRQPALVPADPLGEQTHGVPRLQRFVEALHGRRVVHLASMVAPSLDRNGPDVAHPPPVRFNVCVRHQPDIKKPGAKNWSLNFVLFKKFPPKKLRSTGRPILIPIL